MQFVTVSNTLDMWVAKHHSAHALVHDPIADPITAFILDARGGERLGDSTGSSNAELYHQLGADRESISVAMVVVGRRSAAIYVDIAGARVAKADFNNEILAASLIQHHGSVALRLVADNRTAFIVSLPSLALIRRLSLPAIPS